MKLMSTLLFVAITTSAFAGSPPHMDLDMTSAEYRRLLSGRVKKDGETFGPGLNRALRWGERLATWLEQENARRAPGDQLRLSSAQTRTSTPITTPKVYNEASITADGDALTRELPPAMLAALQGGDFPAALPLPDADFMVLARRVDRMYQSAARFKSLSAWIPWYTNQKRFDVRGFHFFQSNGWTEERMGGFDALPETEKAVIRGHLVGMCQNDGETSLSECRRQLRSAEAQRTLPALFTQWYYYGQQTWDDFFKIPSDAVRRDVTYASDELMTVPFNTPSNGRFLPYLRDNIEDEFQWGPWRLRLNFGTFADGPRLTFQAGTVPHVDRLGGNQIVMDANQPIEEYESQWTIRHEFGHVIGLPDCYHEFYDTDLRAFVSYQLDVTDLMCSRAGDMNERIYQEITRVYRQ